MVVRELRPNSNGNQTAVIVIGEDEAKEFVRRGKLWQGLLMCKIQERIELEKCSRCWAYGHKAWNCSGPDRRANCLNSGKEGHKREDCKGEAFCPLCEVKRHEAGSGRR